MFDFLLIVMLFGSKINLERTWHYNQDLNEFQYLEIRYECGAMERYKRTVNANCYSIDWTFTCRIDTIKTKAPLDFNAIVSGLHPDAVFLGGKIIEFGVGDDRYWQVRSDYKDGIDNIGECQIVVLR